jgi:hypothetical protein
MRYFSPLTVIPPLLFIKSSAGFAASVMFLKAGAIGPVIEEIKPNLKVFA